MRMLLLHPGKGRRNPQNGRNHPGHRLHLRRRCSCRTEDRPAHRRRQDHRSAGRNAQGSRTAFLRGAAGKTCGTFRQRRDRRSFRVKMKPGWELAFRPGFFSAEKGNRPMPLFAHKGLCRRGIFILRSGACDPVPYLRNMPRNFANKGEFMSRAMRAEPPFFFCIISQNISQSELHKFFIMLREKSALLFQLHPLFEQQVQMLQKQRNKAIFIIAISFASHWI